MPADAETADDVWDERECRLTRDEAHERWCCPFVPFAEDLFKRLMKFFALGCKDTLLDIGCGEGHVLVLAAKRASCHCIGTGVDGVLLNTAQEAATIAGVSDQCTWLRWDFHDAEAQDAVATTSVRFVHSWYRAHCGY